LHSCLKIDILDQAWVADISCGLVAGMEWRSSHDPGDGMGPEPCTVGQARAELNMSAFAAGRLVRVPEYRRLLVRARNREQVARSRSYQFLEDEPRSRSHYLEGVAVPRSHNFEGVELPSSHQFFEQHLTHMESGIGDDLAYNDSLEGIDHTWAPWSRVLVANHMVLDGMNHVQLLVLGSKGQPDIPTLATWFREERSRKHSGGCNRLSDEVQTRTHSSHIRDLGTHVGGHKTEE